MLPAFDYTAVPNNYEPIDKIDAGDTGKHLLWQQ